MTPPPPTKISLRFGIPIHGPPMTPPLPSRVNYGNKSYDDSENRIELYMLCGHIGKTLCILSSHHLISRSRELVSSRSIGSVGEVDLACNSLDLPDQAVVCSSLARPPHPRD